MSDVKELKIYSTTISCKHTVYLNDVIEPSFYEDLFKEVYSKLLSKKEIDEIPDGKDLWFSGEEITKKLRGKS